MIDKPEKRVLPIVIGETKNMPTAEEVASWLLPSLVYQKHPGDIGDVVDIARGIP